MNKTDIDWTDYTWNPITGCMGPHGRGRCSYCYAQKLAYGRLRSSYLHNLNVAPGCDGRDAFAPRFWEPRMAEPAALQKPSKIFVCSMGDLFSPNVPERWTAQVLTEIRLNQQHTFQLLTKNPDQLQKWSPFPTNAWVGVTATNTAMFRDATRHLEHIVATVKYVSVEPLIDEVEPIGLILLDWLILGGLSGPTTYAAYVPDVEKLLHAADVCEIPVFLKNNLDWPDERQEWPKGVGTAA